LPAGRATDANFFALVHHVLESERKDTQREQRDKSRQPFSCLQYAAVYRDGVLPNRNDFFPILCSDLSSGGVSFLTNRTLTDQFLVLALGVKPQMFLSAQIVNQSMEKIAGQQVQRVGCQFAGRLQGVGFELPEGAAVGLENVDSALSLLDKSIVSADGERRR
jgi:hypothetical protein